MDHHLAEIVLFVCYVASIWCAAAIVTARSLGLAPDHPEDVDGDQASLVSAAERARRADAFRQRSHVAQLFDVRVAKPRLDVHGIPRTQADVAPDGGRPRDPLIGRDQATADRQARLRVLQR